MIQSWRRRRAARNNNKKNNLYCSDINQDMEIAIPTHFRCPISLDLMKDPVTLSTGITYDRESIEKWIQSGNQSCPVSNQILRSFDQIPNHSIRKMIQDWCVENRSYGVERIPTPRIPVTAYEVSEICRKFAAASQRRDKKKCLELVGKIKIWGKESERNRVCIVDNGFGFMLSASFESFSSVSMEDNLVLLSEILSVLTWMFPLGVEGQSKLGSSKSLFCLIWFLRNGDFSARQNAVLVLKELVSLDQEHVDALAAIEGVSEALVKMIREPICPTATKASLSAIFYIISPSATTKNNFIERFVELGLVPLLLEIIVDAEKSICEKALGVLDCICECPEGRQNAHDHALIVPLLVKKILRVSNLGTEFSVSILWKLSKDEKIEVLGEAVQLGAFQKLLVLLQVGCGQREKATELLKMMNVYRGTGLDCIDSSKDFKYIKN